MKIMPRDHVRKYQDTNFTSHCNKKKTSLPEYSGFFCVKNERLILKGFCEVAKSSIEICALVKKFHATKYSKH